MICLFERRNVTRDVGGGLCAVEKRELLREVGR